MMTAEPQILTHLWQEQGLGNAPFSAVCIISMPPRGLQEANPDAYNNALRDVTQQARAMGVQLCSCRSCGMSLENNVVIRDASGKHFVVGCDCAEKVHDSNLTTEVKMLEKNRQNAIRQAKRDAANEAARLAWIAKLDSQRAVNGGLTDAEVVERNRLAEAELLRVKFSAENDWILSVLKREYQGEFIVSMIEKLESMPPSHLSDRCCGILGDVYAKSFGRRNSKAYNAALEEFILKTDCEDGSE